MSELKTDFPVRISDCIAFRIPHDHRFKRMSAGEAWICKNMGKGSTPPRGKVYRDGKKRFESRTWQKTADGFMEFLPKT